MDNQHKRITGYRDLTQEDIDLMNEIKARGEELRALVAKIAGRITPPLAAIEVPADGEPHPLVAGVAYAVEREADDPLFWLRYADGSFRTGLMFAVRAVARPTSY